MQPPLMYSEFATSGGATGMATIAMAIAVLGVMWPLIALATALFTLCTITEGGVPGLLLSRGLVLEVKLPTVLITLFYFVLCINLCFVL